MANEKLEDYPLYKNYMPMTDMFNRAAAIENTKKQYSVSGSDSPLVIPTPALSTDAAGQRVAQDKLMQLKRPSELPKPIPEMVATEIPQPEVALPAKKSGWISFTLLGGSKKAAKEPGNVDRPDPFKKRTP